MYEYKATVVKIIDGDTARLKVDLGFFLTYENNFRFAGINAPEISGDERESGLITKNFVEKLLPIGTVVKIKTYKADKYGRWLVDIVLSDEKTVSTLLLEQGLAKIY